MPRWLIWIDWRWPFVYRRRGREVLKIRAHGENYGMGPANMRKQIHARPAVRTGVHQRTIEPSCLACRDTREVWCLGGMAGEILMPCPHCRPEEHVAEIARRGAR
jgi:hypothetical protein